MPKVLARDPAWLSKPTPGFNLFQADSSNKSQRAAEGRSEGALRKIAHRETEVFVAVGNELRWSELGLLKDTGEDHERKHGRRRTSEPEEQDGGRAYRILKTPVHRAITQLSVSPSGDYIAILTAHTCHICILPSSEHLRPQETSPLRLKSFQLGPTTHVLEQAPLVSAIWHPLAPSGDCLVTVTHDACVRLWELNSDNRSSFDDPALAVDLKKLANATSSQTDFRASKYGTNKGFSPDDVEMQVAAACFGGQGGSDEHGWASMTLWVAMSEGDVYALCPFLPSKWHAPTTLLPSLSTSVMAKSHALTRDVDASDNERRAVEQQSKWLAEVDSQEPLLAPASGEFDTVEVYSRPGGLGPVPKLQGPFQIFPAPDFGEITDIHVIAPKIDDDALYDEGEELNEDDGLSIGVVCLATSTNEVHVCLDVDGVEAEWLPSKRSRAYTFDDVDESKELALFETVDLARTDDEDDGWPTFTLAQTSRYELFITHSTGICALSFKPWINALESELATPSDNGAGLRLDVWLDSASTLVDTPIEITSQSDSNINAVIAILDPVVGYVVLTTAGNTPLATILDVVSDTNPYAPDEPEVAGLLPAPEPRVPYRPPPDFDLKSELPNLLKSAYDKKLLGGDLKAQVRFSPATLQLMTDAHRIMSKETHRLGMAAADLFRRCERMRSELQEQVRTVAEIAQRVDAVTGQEEKDAQHEQEDDENELTGSDKIEQRVELSHSKTEELNQRVEALKRKMMLIGGKQLSAKEHAFAQEVERLQQIVRSSTIALAHSTSTGDSTSIQSQSGTLSSRFDAVQSLQQKLLQQASAASKQAERQTGSNDGAESKPGGVGNEFRKQKLAQVMALLERETALVEAVMERLRRLQSV